MLFLDEMPEFARRSLEILRQPLEDKAIRISRVCGTYEFPANFILCAAMNPCPCGHYPDMNLCRCSSGEVAHYLGKISQPLLDRIDLCTDVPPVSFSQLNGRGTGETSAEIRKRVERVHRIQQHRYRKENFRFNGELKGGRIEQFCKMDENGQRLMERAFEKIALSARSYHRVLKVARTIADMDGEDTIQSRHIGEALTYRVMDKKYWN